MSQKQDPEGKATMDRPLIKSFSYVIGKKKKKLTRTHYKFQKNIK